jgi:hypothetical protein
MWKPQTGIIMTGPSVARRIALVHPALGTTTWLLLYIVWLATADTPSVQSVFGFTRGAHMRMGLGVVYSLKRWSATRRPSTLDALDFLSATSDSRSRGPRWAFDAE